MHADPVDLRRMLVRDCCALETRDDVIEAIVVMASEICSSSVPLILLSGTERSGGLCRQAIDAGDVLIVGDMRADERFREHPLVTSGLLRSYVGAPLYDTCGQAIGALCVVGGEPGGFDTSALAAQMRPLSKVLGAALAASEARNTLERRLVLCERLATAGMLAVSVGHEINSPLTYLLGNVEHAAEEIRSLCKSQRSLRTKDLLETLEAARQGAVRVRELARGLRSLAREEPVPIPTDVRSALELSLQMTLHELSHRAKLSVDLGELPLVCADDSRLCQIFVNLLVNAAQCFPKDDPEIYRIDVRGRADAEHVVLEFADNGPGISPEILPKIFDPFFTTKPVGQGTGLGLSVCRSVVEALGGTIQCDSDVGIGSCFRVTLRVVTAEHPTPVSGPSANGRVLVIEDEPLLLSSIKRWLVRDGFDVYCSADPLQALALFDSERFDLVLCDVMMPRMSGIELQQRVFERWPVQAERFVFMSGGISSVPLQDMLALGSNERLDKPFSSEDLRRVIRRRIGLLHPHS